MSILDNVLSGISPVVAKPQSAPAASPVAISQSHGYPPIPPAPCPRCQSAFFFLAPPPANRHFCLNCNRPRSPAMIRRLFTVAGWPESPEWVEMEGGRESAGGDKETPTTPAGRRGAAKDLVGADRRPTALSAEFPDHPPADWPADRTYDDWWTESALAALQRYDGTAKMAADVEMHMGIKRAAAASGMAGDASSGPAEQVVYTRKGGRVVKASSGTGGKKRPPGGGKAGGGRSLVA